MGFSTPSYDLTDLFARVDRGDIQLPDFQRDYAWDEDRIRSLIVTVLRGFPIGAFMALDTRNEKMRFRPRPLTGAPDTGVKPGLLLLDGQQRLTTLYHCLRGSGSVSTKDFRSKKITRTFYVDIRRATQEDVMPDDAVFAVNQNGEIRSHFAPTIVSSIVDRQQAIDAYCLPVASLLSEEGTSMLFELAAQSEGEDREALAAFNNRILRPLAAYDVPMIRIARETPLTGIGSIFAQANSAGLQMDVFDLLTAVFASEDPHFHLAQDWTLVEKDLRRAPALDGIGRNEFLSAVSLLVSGERGRAGGERGDIVKLTLNEYKSASASLRITFREVAAFLAQRCIFSIEQVPYTEQIIPLAVILARLAQRSGVLSSQEAWDKINQWFWCGVFGELYGSSAVKLRAARDVEEVTEWVSGTTEEIPKTVRDARFRESRLLSVDAHDGVWHGIYALLMSRGAQDWRTGEEFNRKTVESLRPGFYAIFPLNWCQRHGVDKVLAESVLNRTPMGKRTEVVIDGNSPARYLPRVQSKSIMEDPEFDAVLESHDLDPELLHAAKAEEFFIDRRERFVGIVEHALGKPVIRDVDEEDLAGGEEGPQAFAR
ncbi:GmrSD restriction endonuclease domain-containing protein [Corynebacterium flavescens]